VAHELEEELPERRHAGLLLQRGRPAGDRAVRAAGHHAREQAQVGRQARRVGLRHDARRAAEAARLLAAAAAALPAAAPALYACGRRGALGGGPARGRTAASGAGV